jgi:Ca2+-binding EF-hand superfamily protein
MEAVKQTGLAAAAVLCAMLGSAALAEMGPGDAAGHGPGARLLEMFAGMDADGNGQLTQAEIEAHRAAMFSAADANGDGVLNAEEVAAYQEAQMAAMLAARAARMIERHDDNGDGSLSAEEIGEGPLEDRFALIDTDDDGAISRAEAEAAATRLAEHRAKRKHAPMGGWFN